MQNQNININSRLLTGLLLLFIISAVLSGYVVSKLSELNTMSGNILKHPYAVSNAVRDIKLNIYAMHRSMKDVAMASDEKELTDALSKVDTYEDAIYNRFDLVFERFLGDQQDVEIAFSSFKNWKPIRDEVVALVMEGKQQEAVDITKEKGSDYVDQLQKKTEVMIAFANKKADEFNNNSVIVFRQSYLTFIFAQISMLIIFIIITLWIYNSINNPLKYLINRIKTIGTKSFNIEISTSETNKLTILNTAIDELERQSNLLAEEVIQRTQAQKEVEDYKTNLEKKVEQRTIELEKSNSEANLLAKILNESSQAFAIGNKDGSLDGVNKAFCDLTGYREKELLNDVKWNDTLTPAEYHELENSIIEKLLKTGKAQRYTKEYIKKNGERIFVELLVNRIQDKGGKLEQLYAFITDITEVKAKEAELNEYRNKLEQLVKKRTIELEEKNAELERFNSLFVGREFRIKELKIKIEKLEDELINLKDQTSS
ncbi:PAS domain S-box protein [Bacteroidota bacterium]